MLNAVASRRIKKFILWTEILVILAMALAIGVVAGAFYNINKTLPPNSALDQYRPPAGTKIYSSDGVLLAKLADENREPVKLEDVPKVLRDAIVAIEDARFYRHTGLDYRGLARAAWANFSGQEMSQGASTITQQLARNIFLSPKKTISRKMKEMLIAIQIERNWTKRQILEAYLNQVYFGSNAYGVKAAANTYFGKPLSKLTLEEAAMLAGLPQRPSELSPYIAYAETKSFDRTKFRRNLVLDRMADLGFIGRDKAEKAKKSPIKVAKERPRTIGIFHAPHFVQYVVDQLHKKYGYEEEVIDRAGLNVYTTLNYKMQQVAERVAEGEIRRTGRARRISEAALICIDPHNGAIRALVGSVRKPWEKYQFDCATQARRQPGSSFKMFVYAAALENGDSIYSSVNASASIKMPDGKWYTPQNHGRYGGYMSYVSAFASSVNGAAVNVCVKVGPKKVADLAKKLGITSPLRAYPSLALGTSEVSPLEMASAYGVFPAHGKLYEPVAVNDIRSQDGEILLTVRPKVTDTGLKPETIAGMDQLTRGVVTSGTGRPASVVQNAHGKTGTTEEYTDAWFVGYTPDLVTAVWAGNRDNRQMRGVYGGTVSAPIWAGFMKEAVKLNPSKQKHMLIAQVRDIRLPAPRRERRRRDPDAASADGSIRRAICSESGLIARRGCPSTHVQEFQMGEQPLSRCPIHGGGSRRRKREEPDAPAAEPTPKPIEAGDPPADPAPDSTD